MCSEPISEEMLWGVPPEDIILEDVLNVGGSCPGCGQPPSFCDCDMETPSCDY